MPDGNNLLQWQPDEKCRVGEAYEREIEIKRIIPSAEEKSSEAPTPADQCSLAAPEQR